jgi:hypothetical protein
MTAESDATPLTGPQPQCYWDLTDYSGIVPIGSGLGEAKQRAAQKLADSAVAPLVAAARGVRAYTDIAEKKALYETIGLRDGRTAMARSLATCLDTSDVMTMPWYTVADIKAFHDRPHEGIPTPPFVQARPGNPWEDKKGRPVKYVSVAGARTVIGTHPGHPMSFAIEPDVVLIAEGMLKADSALTGYLLDCGVPVEELASPIDENGSPVSHEEAVVRLRELMTTYCDADDDGARRHKRILIVSLVGVGTWHKNAAELNQIPLRGVEAWVGFDADASKNFQVWSQAKKLTTTLNDNAVTAVKFLVPAGDSGSEADAKLGIDDYLAQVADFHTLTTQQLVDDLPPQPEEDKRKLAGKVRVAADGTSVVKYEEAKDDGITTVYPKTIVEYGGQIVERIRRRQTTEDEERLGEFEPESFIDANVPMEETTTIDIMWHPLDDTGEPNADVTLSRQIRGPIAMLNQMPDQWAKQGAHIHSDILQLPDWPPEKGREFRDAIRERSLYGEHKSKSVTEWMQMGWVPRPNGDPVFIVGDQVVERVEEDSDHEASRNEYSRSGLSAEHAYAPMSSRFGFGEYEGRGQWEKEGHSPDADAYREYARDVFSQVINVYLRSGIWPEHTGDPDSPPSGIAPLVVGAGLRPTIPLSDTLTVYLSGGPGTGKSWTAAAITAFWQRQPGSFDHQGLPGSAGDTFAHMEDMVAHFPLWVIDDLAPTPDRVKERQDQSKLSDMIRAKYNAKGRGRAGISSGGVKAQESKKPRALLVLTAENDLTVPSAMARTLVLPMRKKGLGENINLLEKMRRETTTISQMSAIVVGYLQWRVSREGWQAVVHDFETRRAEAEGHFREVFQQRVSQGSSPERPAHIAADVMIAVDLVAEIARELELDEEIIGLFDAHQLPQQIIDLLIEAHRGTRETQRGYAFVEAIRQLLRTGEAHVLDYEDPTNPPTLPGRADSGITSTAFGWFPAGGDRDGYQPRGTPIGTFQIDRKTGRAFLAIQAHDAFRIAKARLDTINDTDSKNSVSAVYEEELVADFVPREKGRRASKVTTLDLSGDPSGTTRRQMRVLPLDAEMIVDGVSTPKEKSDVEELSELISLEDMPD